MKKLVTIALCVFMFVLFTAAVKKKVKPAKPPKVTVMSLAKELKSANINIEGLIAQKVSLTAKTVLFEADIKKLKKDKDSMIIPFVAAAAIALALAVFIIAGMISKQAEIMDARKKASSGGTNQNHFEDIEAHVLDDWHNIWYHPEKINKELYADLNNHFPELYEKIEKWKSSISRRGVFTGHMISLLSTKFPDIEGTDSIYLLALEGAEPFIEENEIAVGGSVCAHLKRDIKGNRKMMKAYYDEVVSQFKDEFKEVKEVTNEIAALKDEIDVDIRKIKHFRKIQGTCKFINS